MRFSHILALSTPALVLAAPITKRQASETDLFVLRFAHVLEQFETEFYRQAIEKFQPQDFINAGFVAAEIPVEQMLAIQRDEAAHTSILADSIVALGGQTIDNCVFNFDSVLGDVATVTSVARLVENVGVGAYLGAANVIQDPQLLTAAGSILTIEARHQTILNILNGGNAAPQAFDIAFRPEQVVAFVSPFISGCDIGVQGNTPLTVTTTEKPRAGLRLDFSFEGQDQFNTDELFCDMIVGGAVMAVHLPLNDCVIPENLQGPVAIYATNATVPLLNNVSVQFAASVVAGPTMLFLDPTTEAISQLLRTNGAPVDSSNTITPGEASGVADGAQPSPTQAPAAPGAAPEGAVADAINAVVEVDEAGNPIPQDVPPVPQAANAVVIGGPNLATGPNADNSINVIGWSRI